MKNAIFNKTVKVSWLIMLAVLVSFSSCKKDPVVVTPAIVLDGIYVNGAATASSDFSAKQMMKVARNEVTQADRAKLFELYIPIKAGTAGFNIVEVKGSTKTVYGPDADFAVVTTPTNDEPHSGVFSRGTAVVSANKFTVAKDGFYHVVIDMEVHKIVVAEVHWGLIGAATPNGWGGSTDLTESAFNISKMSWTIRNMELRGGDWKFRYSNGWKIELDTAFDLGGGNKGIKVNTNLGDAVATLIPGGANIVNAAPGIYTIDLTYELGIGYKATATKTADLPLTNWTGVICDAVGSGVSVDNASAIPDPSSWGWGNKLLADGAPTKNGDVYTWTWTNITLEANEGFKLRTENGVAPTSGGANFDAGFSAVDVANSSTNVADNGGNLSVIVEAA